MSWKEVSIVEQREQFYRLSQQQSCNFSRLCELFGISTKTGYKWVKRGQEGNKNCFFDRSRRPLNSPNKTSVKIEKKIVKLRLKYPDWGGRKLRRLLLNQGESHVPSPSTITQILKRNNLIQTDPKNTLSKTRFEHETPNALWQMDFKGHFEIGNGRCHPLTVLDDHSRFNLVLKASNNETRNTVKVALKVAFKRFGLPEKMTMDNGSPWGNKFRGRYTQLTLWLMDLGIRVYHSRPGHPQTQGKDERFHRTLKLELLSRNNFRNLRDCQKAFDEWSRVYNYVRPHDSLGLEVPASRYKVSKNKYTESPTPYPYLDEDHLRKVNASGKISFKNKKLFIGEAFQGKVVAVKRTIDNKIFDVYYRHQKINQLSFK